jgi:uncharacterized glyoxalase superfamily protein PhnB
MPTPKISKATPVLVVEAVEPCAQFWQKLGFERGAEVPHGDTLGFIILNQGNVEIMYQSRASVEADDAAMAKQLSVGGTALFVDVDDLALAAKAIEGATIVMPQRETFYGTREIGFVDPGGNLVILAQRIG